MSEIHRIPSIDIGRGFAICCMLAAHIPVTLWLITGIGSMCAPPFFLLISGISFEFFMDSRIQKNISHKSIFLESFSRSVFIYLLPLIPYFAVCLFFPEKFPFQLIHWGVFQVIAVGIILGFFFHGNWKLKVISMFAAFFITIVVQTFFFNYLGFLLSDFTPVLPWIAYFIMGQLIYEVYKRDSFTSSKLLIIAIISFIFSIVFFNYSNIPFNIYSRNQVPAFLLLSSIFFLIQSFLIIFVDKMHKFERVLNPLKRIGKIAFTSYYLSFPLVFGAGFIITKYNLSRLFVIPAILLIICILAIMERYWEKYSFKYGFEWIVRKGSDFLFGWIFKKISAL